MATLIHYMYLQLTRISRFGIGLIIDGVLSHQFLKKKKGEQQRER